MFDDHNTRSTRTLPLALFLLVQNEYWYLGISTGWMDEDWSWWPEYDQHYGKPLGPAVSACLADNQLGCPVLGSRNRKERPCLPAALQLRLMTHPLRKSALQVRTTTPPGWKREFEGCTVTVTSDLLNASIVFHNQSSL